MRQLRITPLNIASAAVLAGLLWLVVDDVPNMGTIGWFFLLLLIMVIADQFFRLMLRSLKRVWMAEGAFLVFVALAVWLLRLYE